MRSRYDSALSNKRILERAGEGERLPVYEMPRAVEQDEVLALRSIRKSFGDYVAVDDVTLSIMTNQVVTLLGPSGCGKTTTLRIAAGLERCGSGEVHLAGRTVDSLTKRIFVRPEKRNIGMVFQSYAIWPHLTVFENVAYPLRIGRRPALEVQAAVMRTLDLVGLTPFHMRAGTSLSGGQHCSG